MKEITELESRLKKLKDDEAERKRIIAELRNEKKLLEQRNKFLIEKLKKASVVYEQAGKKAYEFVNDNIRPMKREIEKVDSKLKRMEVYDREIGEGVKKIDGFEDIVKDFKRDIISVEKKQSELLNAIKELKKTNSELTKKISAVQSFGSEELA